MCVCVSITQYVYISVETNGQVLLFCQVMKGITGVSNIQATPSALYTKQLTPLLDCIACRKRDSALVYEATPPRFESMSGCLTFPQHMVGLYLPLGYLASSALKFTNRQIVYITSLVYHRAKIIVACIIQTLNY